MNKLSFWEKKKNLIKIRAGINKIRKRKTIEKIKKTKSCFFEKINTLGRLIMSKISLQRLYATT